MVLARIPYVRLISRSVVLLIGSAGSRLTEVGTVQALPGEDRDADIADRPQSHGPVDATTAAMAVPIGSFKLQSAADRWKQTVNHFEPSCLQVGPPVSSAKRLCFHHPSSLHWTIAPKIVVPAGGVYNRRSSYSSWLNR
jgi:hypothetical protein